VPWHVARLVTRLVVDYFASQRLVVDYFSYATRPVASARRATCRVLVVDYFASRRLVIDYFAYATCPGASAHRAARHVARCRLLRLV
jgi:hypothetical protein